MVSIGTTLWANNIVQFKEVNVVGAGEGLKLISSFFLKL